MGISDVKAKAQVEEETEGVFCLLCQNMKVIMTGVMLTIGATVGTYITLYFYGTFSVKYLKMPTSASYTAMLLAGVLTFVVGLWAGYLSDRMGRKKMILMSRVLMLVLAYPSFWLLVNYPKPEVLWGVVFVTVTVNTIGCVPGMLVSSELFPKRIRAMGFALVYSIGVAIFGGFAQFFAAKSIDVFGSLTAPSYYLIFGIVVALCALPLFEEKEKLAD